MIASGGFADGAVWWPRWRWVPTASTWARGSCAPSESAIHQNVKDAIVAGSELDTELIFRSCATPRGSRATRSHARWWRSSSDGGQFEDVKDLVAGNARREGLRDRRPGRGHLVGRDRRWA